MTKNKTLLTLSIAAAFSTQSITANAVIIDANFDGLFTMMFSDGSGAVQNVSYPYYGDTTWGYGLRTQITGSITFNTNTGTGSAIINPFEFFSGGLASFSDVNLQSIGDGNGNAGNLVLGNMLFSWDANTYNTPLSIVWDASGFLDQSSYYAGQLISSVGATPATDGVLSSSEVSHSMDIGPSPFATTTFNTTSICTADVTTRCTDVNPNGTLPLTDDGIGGSPFIDSYWMGFNPNIDITTINITSVSAVPLPAAVWLFGSGLIGLIGMARRNAHNK